MRLANCVYLPDPLCCIRDAKREGCQTCKEPVVMPRCTDVEGEGERENSGEGIGEGCKTVRTIIRAVL